MLAFVPMTRPWIWFFAVLITLLFVAVTFNVTVRLSKRDISLLGLALALWSVFYFYAVLATPRGAVTFDPAWWAAHKKAARAFVTVLLTQLSALLALGVLSGPVSHDVALGLQIAGPIFAFLGVKYSPPNAPPLPK